MMPWRLYNDAATYIFTWLIGYGALLGPVAGIMIADYFVVRRGVLLVTDLYKRHGAYEYWRGCNWLAVIALVLGVAPSLPGFLAALRGVPETGLFGTIYNWAWFVGFLLSALIYVIGMRVFERSTEQGAVRAGV
jgi:NCS1 family nucleobase:cation symporter-1